MLHWANRASRSSSSSSSSSSSISSSSVFLAGNCPCPRASYEPRATPTTLCKVRLPWRLQFSG